MATWYSDVFQSGSVAATARTQGYLSPYGRQSPPKAVGRVVLTGITSYLTNDLMAFMPIDPNDRLISLFLTTDANFNSATTLTLNLGVHRLTVVGDVGAFVSTNKFVAALVIKATAIARVDQFTGNTLVNLDRYKRFWELMGLSAAPSPVENWCLTGQFGITGAVSAGGIAQLEAEIAPG